MNSMPSPSTLGVVILLLLVTFSHVRSHRRTKRFEREVSRVRAEATK